MPLTHNVSLKAYLGEFAGAIVYCAMLLYPPLTNPKGVGRKRWHGNHVGISNATFKIGYVSSLSYQMFQFKMVDRDKYQQGR